MGLVLSSALIALLLTAFQNCGEAVHETSESSLGSHALKKATCTPDQIPGYRTSLLTKSEVEYVLTDIFPAEVAAMPSVLTTVRAIPEIQVDQLSNQTVYPENNETSGSPGKLYQEKLIEAADILFQRIKLNADYKKACASDAGFCQNFLDSTYITKLWRRPLTDTERANLKSTFSLTTLPLESRAYAAFSAAINSPQFYFKNYLPPAAPESDLVYDSYAFASRLSFFLYNSVPDGELWQAAAAGKVQTKAELEYHVDRLLKQPKYADRFVRHTLAIWAGITGELNSTNQMTNDKGAKLTASTMALQIYKQLYDMTIQNQPLANFVNPGYVYLNTETAAYLGLSTAGLTADFRIVNATPAAPGGYFTSPHFAMKARKTLADTKTLVSARGINFAQRFLCVTIPPNELNPALVASVLGPNPELLTQIQVGQKRISNTACYHCHGVVDKLGMALEYVDAFGRIRTNYPNGEPIKINIELDPYHPSDRVQSLSQFLSRIGDDERFQSCFMRTVSNKIAPMNPYVDQGCVNDAYKDRRGPGIRDFVISIVNSPVFFKAKERP